MTAKSKHLDLMASGLRLSPPQFQTISLIGVSSVIAIQRSQDSRYSYRWRSIRLRHSWTVFLLLLPLAIGRGRNRMVLQAAHRTGNLEGKLEVLDTIRFFHSTASVLPLADGVVGGSERNGISS